MAVANLSECMQTIGNYDLLAKLAEGGMGTVYRGRNRSTGEIVAVKVVPPHLLSNPVVVKRFEQEYNVARSIDHPNIVKALDFGREGDVRYLVMEFVDGESLGQKIERDGRMSEEEAIRITSQVALGLQAAHALGVIHRDVKPDNVLVTADGQAKLTDLGLVKELEADLNLTRTGRGLGTPHFMAPEQFRNAKKADIRCDIYSLGATLYMMVTGELPFKSNGPLDAWMKKINNEIDAPRKLTPSLSERVDWAIRRAMSPDPVHRPECCREFIEDLSGHDTKEVVGTEPGNSAMPSYWYMTYTDDLGEGHTVKGTIKGIRRSFKEGLLGDAKNIRVARTMEGPYEPLRQRAEFRDLVVQPQASPTALPTVNKGSDPRPKTPASITPVPATSSDPAIPGTTGIKISTVKSVPMPRKGPCYHLEPTSVGLGTEGWRWLVLSAFFISVGLALSYFHLPILRFLRFWIG
jgi:eukaryotic-like serine/threonine-protein kinase